jgi:hypothetical protein
MSPRTHGASYTRAAVRTHPLATHVATQERDARGRLRIEREALDRQREELRAEWLARLDRVRSTVSNVLLEHTQALAAYVARVHARTSGGGGAPGVPLSLPGAGALPVVLESAAVADGADSSVAPVVRMLHALEPEAVAPAPRIPTPSHASSPAVPTFEHLLPVAAELGALRERLHTLQSTRVRERVEKDR